MNFDNMTNDDSPASSYSDLERWLGKFSDTCGGEVELARFAEAIVTCQVARRATDVLRQLTNAIPEDGRVNADALDALVRVRSQAADVLNLDPFGSEVLL